MKIIRSVISVSSTPTKVCSLFLRVKMFIFFSLSLSSMTFWSFFFLTYLWFSHSFLQEKDTLPVRAVILWVLYEIRETLLRQHVSGFTQGLLWVPWHLGTYQVLPNLIHYLGRRWPVQALSRFSGVREQRHSIWLPVEKNCSDFHRDMRRSSDDLVQVWPLVTVF